MATKLLKDINYLDYLKVINRRQTHGNADEFAYLKEFTPILDSIVQGINATSPTETLKVSEYGVYLAYPMFHASISEAETLIERRKQLYKVLAQCIAIDDNYPQTLWIPRIQDPYFIEQAFSPVHVTPAAALVECDKAEIEACSVFILDHTLGASAGSSMELFYAHSLGKLTLTLCTASQIMKHSPWINYHSSYMYDAAMLEPEANEGCPYIGEHLATMICKRLGLLK